MNEELEKAKAKGIAHHFRKGAAHHDAKAGHHEKAAAAHHSMAEHHQSMHESAEGDMKAHHKAKAAFHKTKAAHHEKVHKLHKAYADHHRQMADAHEANDASKVYKILGIEEEPLTTRPTTEDVSKTSSTTTVPPATTTSAPAAAAAQPNTSTETSGGFEDNIRKALDTKLTEGVGAALERLLSSDDFNKRLDNEIAKKLLEKLGSTTIPTEVKTVAVPRGGNDPRSQGNGNGAVKTVDTSKLDPELADLVKCE